MSLASKMAEIEQANTILNEQIASLESTVSEKEVAIAAMVADHEAKVSEFSAKITELESAKSEDAAKITALEADSIAVKAELEAAKNTLANPAYKAASASGAEAVELGAEESAGQMAVDEKAEARKVIDEFVATADGVERANFLRANGEKLQAAYNLLSNEG